MNTAPYSPRDADLQGDFEIDYLTDDHGAIEVMLVRCLWCSAFACLSPDVEIRLTHEQCQQVANALEANCGRDQRTARAEEIIKACRDEETPPEDSGAIERKRELSALGRHVFDMARVINHIQFRGTDITG